MVGKTLLIAKTPHEACLVSRSFLLMGRWVAACIFFLFIFYFFNLVRCVLLYGGCRLLWLAWTILYKTPGNRLSLSNEIIYSMAIDT